MRCSSTHSYLGKKSSVSRHFLFCLPKEKSVGYPFDSGLHVPQRWYVFSGHKSSSWWKSKSWSFSHPFCYLDTIFRLYFNRLTPKDPYMGRTAPLTSKRCILYIYSTNVGTEYFKHALYSPLFSLQNVVCFIMLTCLVPVLFTFYIQVC